MKPTYLTRWRSGMVAAVMSVSLLFAGCSGSTPPPQEANKIWKVTTTTGMVADIVKQVGGEHVEVTQLMGAGVDPHLYKASEGDIKRLDQADIIFYSGQHLEGKMGEIFEKMGESKPVKPVTAKLTKEDLLSDPAAPENPDPHVWFDVSLWIKSTEQVRDDLNEFDPANKDTYTANAEKYLAELKDLDDYARTQLATIPKERRVLVTAHDAFQYFGRAYDVEVLGLQGISTASEYGLKDVQQLVDTLVSRQIKAVFVESSVPKRSIEAVVQGAAAKNHTVTIGGELFSDAMGAPGTPEGTYIGMVKHNVDTIVKALK